MILEVNRGDICVGVVISIWGGRWMNLWDIFRGRGKGGELRGSCSDCKYYLYLWYNIVMLNFKNKVMEYVDLLKIKYIFRVGDLDLEKVSWLLQFLHWNSFFHSRNQIYINFYPVFSTINSKQITTLQRYRHRHKLWQI